MGVARFFSCCKDRNIAIPFKLFSWFSPCPYFNLLPALHVIGLKFSEKRTKSPLTLSTGERQNNQDPQKVQNILILQKKFLFHYCLHVSSWLEGSKSQTLTSSVVLMSPPFWWFYFFCKLNLAPPPPTEYGTQPQFHTQVLRTSSTEKILKSPPPTHLSIYSVE